MSPWVLPICLAVTLLVTFVVIVATSVRCTRCGMRILRPEPHYCPRCGRRVCA